jgi:TonB family protein
MSRPHRTGPATLAALAALASIAVFALASCGRGRMPVAAAGEGEVKAVVSLERVEVRSGPAGDAPRAGTLARGAEVRLRGYSGGFARVLLPSGAEGWLPAGSFERQPDREARRERTDAVARFAPQPGRMLEPTQLFLAPDYGAAQYGRLEEGASLEVLLADHDFYGVLLPGKVLAFVPARSVRLVAPALAPAPTPIQTVAGPPGGSGGQPSFPPTPSAPEVVHQVPYEALPADAEAPVLVTRVDPRYPEFARKAGLSGDVQLRVLVDVDGRVSRVEVVAGAPGGLTEAATEAVRRWVYEPARVGGRPIAVWKVVRVHFAIDGKKARGDETPPL